MPLFPSGPQAGALIVDTSCLKRLLDPSTRARLVQQLRLIDFTPWPSAINAIEVAAHSNQPRQAQFQEVLRFLAEDRLLLPWPHDILKDVGLTLINRQRIVKLRQSGLDYLIREPVGPKHLSLAKEVAERSKSTWTAVYSRIRSQIISYLKAHGRKSPWNDAPAFLDTVIGERKFLVDFMASLWGALDLPGTAPVEQLILPGPWRALVEGHAILAYEQAFTGGAQPKPAHAWDLLQVVYMAGPSRKILVTEDRPFLRAARAVIVGRYPNASVLHWDEFLE